MHAIERFSLERHPGPYESWPRRSRLLDGGAPTGLALPGFVMLHQFELPCGYLLVLDDDCPYEEITSFCLLSPDLRVLSRRWFGVPYQSYCLRAIDWIDERRLVAEFVDAPYGYDSRWGLSLRNWGIPYLRPRLGLHDPRRWPAARERFDTQH